jgi:hypothetical protein
MDVFTLSAKLVLDTSQFTTDLAQAEKTTKGFGTVGKTVAGVAATAITATAAAAGKFFKDAMNAGMDFDAMMSEVQSVSQASGDDFDALRLRAIELGSSTKFTATEAAGALYYMGMAGWDTEQMLAGIDGVLSLAAASGMDLASTSDIVTDAMTAFGIEAEDASHFANILAATATKANTNVGMMGETFKFVAPVAGSMSLAAEDMAEAIGVMANQGVKAGQAGRYLRQIILRLGTDTGASADKLGARGIMESLGVEFYEYGAEEMQAFLTAQQEYEAWMAEGEHAQEEILARQNALAEMQQNAMSTASVRDFSEFITEARAAWAQLDEKTATEYAKQIAGEEGATGWLALMNASQEEFAKLSAAIQAADEGNGAAQEMAETMLDNLQGDITILNSALEGLQIAVSDQFKDSFRDFVQTLTTGISDISDAINQYGLAGGIWALITGKSENERITDQMESDISAAEVNAFQASGLLDYMEQLRLKYGEEVTATNEWKTATEQLNAIMPQVGAALTAQGTSLEQNLATARAMTEEIRQQAIQQAMNNALASQVEYLGQQETKKATAEVSRDMAQAQMGAMNDQMIAMINAYSAEQLRLSQQYNTENKGTGLEIGGEQLTELENLANLTAEAAAQAGYTSQDLMRLAQGAAESLLDAYPGIGHMFDEQDYIWNQAANDNLLTPEQIAAIGDQMDQYQSTIEQANADIAAAEAEIAETTEQIDITRTAIQRAAEYMSTTAEGVSSAGNSLVNAMNGAARSLRSAASGTGNTTAALHAKGAYNIPYDDYPAILHRGEMVLTASQARRYRDGEGGMMDFSGFLSALRSEIASALASTPVNAYLNGEDITDHVNRSQANDYTARRYAPA